jgi:2-succinyl-5-enolpyruvyl-6-hydroxy-3-cyclohexene-1-carboxylate synthase
MPGISVSWNGRTSSTPRCWNSSAQGCDTLEGVNPSTTQARIVVDELIRGGVRDVVLCPGSRNAPLAFALHDADRAGRLRLHVRIDERTAGYLAIGLAVSAGAPVCVAMTSGTAVANLGPAVAEANYARVPLVVLSANRPYDLLGTGANQTMEQLGYFGSQVRETISLGLAEGASEKMAALNAQWRSATCRVLAAAKGSRTANAGPVQFDIPLRDPLVPDEDDTSGAGMYAPAGRPGDRPWTYTPPVTFDQPLDVDVTLDTVVIAGHGAGAHPNLAGLPTVAEPTAPRAVNPLHPLTLPKLRPHQVIMLGRPTLHRPVSTLLADPSVPVFALTTGPRWPDVSGNSQATGTRAVTTGTPNPGWLSRCAAANARAVETVRAQLEAHPLTTGLHVAAAVVDGLRDGDQLVLGASNPVRDAALVGLNAKGVQVRSNRGVAGIDGTVSTAIGAALAHDRTGGRTIALIGDLTFVHDSSGLLIGPTEPTPRSLTIVVSNDNGGGIFELLEQGDPRFSDVSSRVFGTPHDVDVGALCRAYHVESRQVDIESLTEALHETFDGMRVLEVKADRSSLRALHASIRAAL